MDEKLEIFSKNVLETEERFTLLRENVDKYSYHERLKIIRDLHTRSLLSLIDFFWSRLLPETNYDSVLKESLNYLKDIDNELEDEPDEKTNNLYKRTELLIDFIESGRDEKETL